MPNTHETLTSLFTDIADAIRAKTGDSSPIVADAFPTAIGNITTASALVSQDLDGNLVFPPTGDAVVLEPLMATSNGTYTPASGHAYNSVVVNTSATPTVRKEVNYYDFDGTLLYAYTATEFSALTEHPAEPTHSGLTSLGWNWDLSNAKTFVNKYGTLDLGMNYETDDNACRFYITLDSAHLTQTFGVDRNGASGLTYDWGDGTTPTSVTGSGFQGISHTYAQAGSYVISVTFTSGKIGIGNGSILTTKSALKKVEFNSSVDFLGNSAFESCTELKTITFSNSITGWGGYIFKDCHSLQFVCMPKASGVNMGWINVWDNCYSLQEIVVGQSTAAGSNPSMTNNYSLFRFTELGTSQPSITNTYSLQEVVFT